MPLIWIIPGLQHARPGRRRTSQLPCQAARRPPGTFPQAPLWNMVHPDRQPVMTDRHRGQRAARCREHEAPERSAGLSPFQHPRRVGRPVPSHSARVGLRSTSVRIDWGERWSAPAAGPTIRPAHGSARNAARASAWSVRPAGPRSCWTPSSAAPAAIPSRGCPPCAHPLRSRLRPPSWPRQSPSDATSRSCSPIWSASPRSPKAGMPRRPGAAFPVLRPRPGHHRPIRRHRREVHRRRGHGDLGRPGRP